MSDSSKLCRVGLFFPWSLEDCLKVKECTTNSKYLWINNIFRSACSRVVMRCFLCKTFSFSLE
ncbi:hypothetical protein KP509_09G003900 [Ceratopteris richardii]|uniref:Uncharacterized protein n=1 Tax=Ceratopteris richardii TaxID=49495 RepID=A0A8T2U413_CERRI|nr:hypothetical protein KP509_09G003900 [Ceratopteris richardii]